MSQPEAERLGGLTAELGSFGECFGIRYFKLIGGAEQGRPQSRGSVVTVVRLRLREIVQ